VTALATETEVVTQPGGRDLSARLFEPSGSTLEDAILGAWEDLSSNGRTACPVCAGELRPGGCVSCGSELS
jgi:hypothetical protein